MLPAMETLIRAVDEHHRAVAIVSLLLTIVATIVVATRWNIDSDFKALLPQDSPAAEAMTEVGERVGSGSALFVVIDSPDQDANIEFAGKYAAELRKMDEVALAHYHNDKTFFEKHALLYLEREDLQQIRERLAEAIKEAKRRANPLFVALDKPEPVTLKTDDLEEKYEGDLAQNKYKEYLVSDDGYALTIMVRFVETSTNLTATNTLLEQVERVGEQLDPKSFHEEMTIELGGGLVNRKREYDSLLGDVQISAVSTVLALFAVIALYFRRFRAVVLVLGPLAMSVLWTLALALLIFEALTTITAFIFAILLGLGIDFSIHLLSSYDNDRARGMERLDALIETYRGTGTATLLGAGTTFGVFVVLSFAQFRGLSQFGVVASVGVVAAALAMTVTLPALIAMLDRWAPVNPRERLLPIDPQGWSKRRAFAMLAAAAVLTGAALFSAPDIVFEENFRSVGQIDWPWKSPEDDQMTPLEHAESHGKRKGKWVYVRSRDIRGMAEPDTFINDRQQETVGQKYASGVGKLQTSTPTIVLFDEPARADQTYRALLDAQESGEVDTIKGVASIWAFVPPAEDQADRLEEIRAIRELIEKENIKRFTREQQQQIEELRPKLDVEVFDVYDLPGWAKRLFREAGPGAKAPADGEEFAFEYTVYLNEGVRSMVGEDARRFLADVTTIGTKVGFDLRVASPSVVYVAMLDNIKTDGARMMAIALVVVLLLLVLGFRNPVHATIALLPLTFGVAWMIGLAAFLGIKLDFFNVIILPVIIGIGVDDGVHFFHHWLESGSVGDTVQRVGASVTMTSVTSMIGFGGLAITDYAGLASIGHLAICGIATTWIATLIVMPAVLTLKQGSKDG